MVTWGLGIEHEFILRYLKKKNVNNTYYDIFINSLLVYKLNVFNEINLYDKYKNFIKNDKHFDDYNEKMNNLLYIRKLAVGKKKFPFDQKKFFEMKEIKNTKQIYYELSSNTINHIKIYLFTYFLHHIPILFFNYNFNGNEINCGNFDSFIQNSNINKEDLLKYHYDLLNILYENEDIFNYKEEILNQFKKNYKVVRIHGVNNILLKSNEDGNLKNKKDFIFFIDEKIKSIRKFVYNDIKYNPNIIKHVFFCYQNEIPILDGSSQSYVLEMKTINYKNLNYEIVYQDFIKYEKSFIEYINTIFNHYLKKYGDINYNSIGSRKEALELTDLFNESNHDLSYRAMSNEDYTGSYHIWITIPYDEKISKFKFLNMHANLANKLQLLEPIIACNFTSPSYKIKYNKNYPSKMSLRHFLNSYSNYGTSDVSLINGTNYTYVSDIFFEKHKNPTIHKIACKRKKVYNSNNTLIKSYDALDRRFYTNNINYFLTDTYKNSKNIEIKSFYELLFKNKEQAFKEFQKIYVKEENKKKKPKDIDLGADIRTRNNNYLVYPIDSKYKKIYYPKKNKYIEYYLDENNIIHEKRIYNKDDYNKFLKEERTGIEFRILDHFPTIYLDQILSIISFLVCESYETYPIKSIYNTYISEQFWHNEMYQVIVNGYTHNFSKAYISKLNKEFKLNISNKKYTSELLLEEIYTLFIQKYSKLRKYKALLNKIKFNNKVLFINFNEYATKFIQKNN